MILNLLKKRKNKRLLQYLIGFHQIVYTIHNRVLELEDDMKATTAIFNLESILLYHRHMMAKLGITKTKLDKNYTKYINGWNKLAKKNEPVVKKLMDEIKKKRGCSYII